MTVSERYERLKQSLSDALATSGTLASLVDGLPSDDPFRRFSPWLGTANAILKAETSSPSEAIADHLASLESAVRRARPQTWPATNFGYEVKSAWGIFIADLATASEAARDLGKTARDTSIRPDLRREVDAAPLRSALEGMLKRLDALNEQLKDLKQEATPERTESIQQTGLISVYVDEMKTEASVLTSEMTSGDTIDLSLIGRAVERMTELTSDFVTTTKKLGHLISISARKAAEIVRGGVHSIVRGTRAVLRVVRGKLSLRHKSEFVEPDRALSAGSDVKTLVHNMILRGEVPSRELAKQITSLNFYRDELVDLAPLVSLTALKSLDLTGTQVSNLAPLASLMQLESLSLWGSQVSDLTPLASLVQLRSLSLGATHVSDLAPLASLTQLQSLDAIGTRVGDLAPLTNLTRLQNLDLMETPVSDLMPLASLRQLHSLDLTRTRVRDLPPLANLPKLRRLQLTGAPVWDLSPLASLTQLQILDLRETLVRDISPLASLMQLRRLDLSSTPVGDVAALASLKQLLYLDLSGTQVSDLSALMGLAQLQHLDLRGTHVIDLSPVKHVSHLIDASGA